MHRIGKVSSTECVVQISAAFSVKYDTINAKGKGDVVNSEQIKDSDLSLMLSVKVVNQVITDHSLTKVSQFPGLKQGTFADIYGDCFISGFEEGGEFTAIISIKVKDRTQVDSIVGR